MTGPTSAKRRRLGRALPIAVILILTGCGTRLPDSAFAPFVVNPTTGTVTQNGTTAPSGNTPSGLAQPTTGPSTGPSGLSNPSAPGPGTVTQPSTGSGHTTGTKVGPTTGPTTKTGGQQNFASDRGVTANSITVCNVVTQGGPFGPYQFTPSYYGAAAYFAALNAAGGINGRRVNFISHPDDGSDSGDLSEIHTCIDTNKAFAFVANNIYQYAGAQYTYQKNIPDVGSQPISTAYYIYPNLFSIDGDHQPRDGKHLGLNGLSWRTDEESIYFKNVEHIKHVGVVYYDQASSQYGANTIVDGFKTAGVPVSEYQVNLGLPNFASAVAQMKADGVDMVADALDQNGSQKLCEAIEQNSAFLNQMKIKLTTLAGWGASVGTDFSNSPVCADKSWTDAYSVNFQDTSNPQVAKYQAAMRQYFPSFLPHNHQFAFEGWIGAMWFSDAAASCGADLTRTCIEKFMNRPVNYTARGLLIPSVSFILGNAHYYHGLTKQCVSVAQWSNSANRWITRADPQHNCYMSKAYSYALTAPT